MQSVEVKKKYLETFYANHPELLYKKEHPISHEEKMVRLKEKLNSPEVKEKRRKTNMERYGVPNALQSKEIQEKVISTNLERFGVEYASQNSQIREKIRKTNLERYGVETPF